MPTQWDALQQYDIITVRAHVNEPDMTMLNQKGPAKQKLRISDSILEKSLDI